MSYLLDTDAISQLSKDLPHQGVLGWLETVDLESVYLSAITFAELRRGMELLPRGKKRLALEDWLQHEVAEAYDGRILPVDATVADLAGRLGAKAKSEGLNLELADVLIAATAVTHGLAVVTLNRKHFERLGAELVTF